MLYSPYMYVLYSMDSTKVKKLIQIVSEKGINVILYFHLINPTNDLYILIFEFDIYFAKM